MMQLARPTHMPIVYSLITSVATAHAKCALGAVGADQRPSVVAERWILGRGFV